MNEALPASDAHAKKKHAAVVKAEAQLVTARERLDKALGGYDSEVERHKERGDGFFSSSYLVARKEAVLARKHYEARLSALNTARAEEAAPTIGGDAA